VQAGAAGLAGQSKEKGEIAVKKIMAVLVWILGLGGLAAGQTATQHFVVSASADGQPASIMSTGFQLTSNVSLAYEYISNPSDSSKPRYGSGVANYTREVASFLPSKIKSKLLIDTTKYLVTFQAGAGRESLAGAKLGDPRVSHIIGNFGIYGSRPVANNVQLGLGYKFIWGPHSAIVKVPVGNLTFTF
jgi:hypothetical protein